MPRLKHAAQNGRVHAFSAPQEIDMTTPASTESLTEARKIENTVNKQASPEAAWKQLARDMHANSSDMNSVLAQIAKDDKTTGTFVLPSLTIAYHKDQINEGTAYAK